MRACPNIGETGKLANILPDDVGMEKMACGLLNMAYVSAHSSSQAYDELEPPISSSRLLQLDSVSSSSRTRSNALRISTTPAIVFRPRLLNKARYKSSLVRKT